MKNKLKKMLSALGITTSPKKKESTEHDTAHRSQEVLVFSDGKGNSISKKELKNATGVFNYNLLGIATVSEKAKLLHGQARYYGENGAYEKAIEALQEAHKEATHWPFPLYDLAYTYLLLDDYENALKYYRLTDAIAPRGFYTSKTAIHTLEKELTGEFQKGLYKAYISMEWIENVQEKKEMAVSLIENIPSFAPAWKEYSNFLNGRKRIEAIEQGLAVDLDIETKGNLLINKALALHEEGEVNNATKILTAVIFDSDTTLGNLELAKFALNHISGN